MITDLMKPVAILIAWSLAIMLLLLVRRLQGVKLTKRKPDDELVADQTYKMPVWERQTAANYNHLMEQPTIFYAFCFAIALMGHVDGMQVWLAWAYVSLRVVHSLIQVTYHKVMHRFLIFILSSVVLMAMVVRELLRLI